MTVAGLLTQTIEILPLQETSADEYNDPEPSFGDPVELKGYLEQGVAGQREVTVDRETALSLWKLVVPADTAISHNDRVRVGDRTFAVETTPWRVYNPRTQVVSHVEAALRLVED